MPEDDAESIATTSTTATNSPPTMRGSTTPWNDQADPQPGSSNWSEQQIQAEAAKRSAASAVMEPLLIAESVETVPSRFNFSFGTFGKGKETKKMHYTKLESEEAAEMQEETAL